MTTPPISKTPRTDAAFETMLKASRALYLEVPESVADFFANILADLFSKCKAVELENTQLRDAAGFCSKHQPSGGTRNCLVCACEKLSFALIKISYLCGSPNKMQQSDYDTHFNEEEVVKQVTQLREELANANSSADIANACELTRLRERLTQLEAAGGELAKVIEWMNHYTLTCLNKLCRCEDARAANEQYCSLHRDYIEKMKAIIIWQTLMKGKE